MRIFRWLIITAFFLNVGCATISYRGDVKNDFPPSFYPPYYPATMLDLYLLAFTLNPICLIDMPFSLVSDTLLLPYDYGKEYRKHQDKMSRIKRYEEEQTAKRRLEAEGKLKPTEKPVKPASPGMKIN